MARSITTIAGDCVDAAAGLDIFLDNTGRQPDIRDSINELIAISKVLYAINSVLDHDRYGRISVPRDLNMALDSIYYTVNRDVKDMFAQTRFVTYVGGIPYRTLWDNLNRKFHIEDSRNLLGRLRLYQEFLHGMLDVLRRRDPQPSFYSTVEKIERMLQRQEPIESSFDRMAFGIGAQTAAPPLPPRARTPSRPKTPTMRPAMHQFSTYPAFGMQPPPFGFPATAQMPMPQSPISSSSDSWDFIPPPVPDVPQSPVYSDSSQQTWFSNSSNEKPHWASKVLSIRHPRTEFRTMGQVTKCDGRDQPGSIERLAKEGSIEVFRQTFEDSKAVVKFFWRPYDYNTRVLYTIPDRRSNRLLQFSLPTPSLKLYRVDNCIQLYRYDREIDKYQYWANLSFNNYESMVLFCCTFTAMKRQQVGKISQQLEDYTTPGERLEFSGEIEDADFKHIFRVIRDRDSGCVRFQASAMRGKMKETPIWTAFVTDFVGSKTWMRRLSSKTVQLSQLHPHIFCDNYKPWGATASSGVFQLKFTRREDAEAFMDVFNKIY